MHQQEAGELLGAGESRLPEKKWALKPFLETVLSDLNSTRMLLYWEVMTSGFSEPQNLPCSLESAVSPLRTSTKSYLHTCPAAQLQTQLCQGASPDHPRPGALLSHGSFPLQLPALPNLTAQNGATLLPADGSSRARHTGPSPAHFTGFRTPCAKGSWVFKALPPEHPASPSPSPLYILGVYFFQGIGSRHQAGLHASDLLASPQPWAALTSLPSVSKKSNCREMRYWVGATNCQMQFLLGGYSLGQPGLVIEPLSLVRNPPQAAGGTKEVALPSRSPRFREGHETWVGAHQGEMGLGSGPSRQRKGGRGWGWG